MTTTCPKYRPCTNADENIDNLISGCSTLSSNKFKYEHGRGWETPALEDM